MASIILEKVSVSFPVYSSATRSIKNRLINSATGGQIRSNAGAGAKHMTLVQALQDIDLKLDSGDRIGLVGHNGAGKTTLLRVLAGIFQPNEGQVIIEGTTVPLFDISLGMDPESNGYENILLRGIYLGLTRTQIKARMDEIADFTELGDFLDLPIRTYSAGMQMRLAFAVSTCVAPDILLLDEGIGAGDAAFIKKASERLKLFMEKVSIIVLSSHSEELISRICTKALLLEHGRVIGAGTTAEILEQYRVLRGGPEAAAQPQAQLVITEEQTLQKTDQHPALRAIESPSAAPTSAALREPRTLRRTYHQPGDLHRWADTTAQLLQAQRWDEIDLERLIAGVQSLGVLEGLVETIRSPGSPPSIDIRDALHSLIHDLLIWHFLLERRSEPQRARINQSRSSILAALQVEPELFVTMANALAKTYASALAAAMHDAGLPPNSIRPICPVSLTTLLHHNWCPCEPTYHATQAGCETTAPKG